MRVKLLPSRAGFDSQRQSLTTFLINDELAIDGGSIGFALEPEEMVRIQHVLVTHAHSDHTASLPIFVAEVFPHIDRPVSIYALDEVVSALRQFVFNNEVWPDFEEIRLMGRGVPALEFHQLEPRRAVELCGLAITPIPVNHVVPNVGLLVQDRRAAVIFTSDTYVTDEIWQTASEIEKLRAIFVDVSYPDELEELAVASKHLTPRTLGSELRKLDRHIPVLAVHIKPSSRDDVVRQLALLNDPRVAAAEIGRVYEW